MTQAELFLQMIQVIAIVITAYNLGRIAQMMEDKK